MGARPTVRAQIPGAFRFLADPPLGEARIRGSYGGRGSGKSWSFARQILVHGVERPLRILCAREYQVSIRESVHALLASQVEKLGLGDFYRVTPTTLFGANGTEFIFKGLKRDPAQVKSLEGIDLAWIEEAEAFTEKSWSILTPTIRKPGSEIWVSWNTGLESDPTHQRLVTNPPPRSIIRKVGYKDNPWLPDVLREEAEELRRRDPEAYAHIWGGEPWTRSESQILSGKVEVQEFEPLPSWDGPLFGADWGFARDPSALVKLWLADSRLYVEAEAGGVGLDMDALAREFGTIDGATVHKIRADSARPETINEMNRRGFNVVAAPKWAGSVEDGIAHLRSYEAIVVHPRCRRVVEESRLYRYKVDERTGAILPKARDEHNHWIDAIRYALSPMIRRESGPRIWFPGMAETPA